MAVTVNVRLQQSALAAVFIGTNPILALGEIGKEIDTGQYKVGNGIGRWKNLPYGSGNAPIVTGSKGANAALTSLLGQLAALGIITDSTT